MVPKTIIEIDLKGEFTKILNSLCSLSYHLHDFLSSAEHGKRYFEEDICRPLTFIA